MGPHPGTPQPLFPARPKSRHASNPHPSYPSPGTPLPHRPGTPPPHRPGTMGLRPKFRHASAPHPGPLQVRVPACLRPTSGTPAPSVRLTSAPSAWHTSPIGPAHLRPSYLRAPGPPTRPASAPRPGLLPLLSPPLEAIVNLFTRSQQESYVARIQQGRGRRRSRLSPASTACFHGVSNSTHSSSRTHSSSLNKCLHNFEGHSSTSMLLSCWRIKLGSNPKGSHSISTRCLRRFTQSLCKVYAGFTQGLRKVYAGLSKIYVRFALGLVSLWRFEQVYA